MPTVNEVLNAVESGKTDKIFSEIYPSVKGEKIKIVHEKYIELLHSFSEIYGEKSNDDIMLFSSPGRTELGGNQVDHSGGCVLAAAVDLDIIAAVRRRDDGKVSVKSKGYPCDNLSCDDLTVHNEEKNTSAALIRGVLAGLSKKGCKTGGFEAYTISDVPKGAGLSSSAAFEVLIGEIQNRLYNDGKISPVKIAQIAQFSEREYFGKPCGLMDQTACAVGGIIAIDFADEKKPEIEKLYCDFAANGYALCIINTGSCHADLTNEYAAVPSEMFSVAHLLGKNIMRESSRVEIEKNITQIREKYGDRALLRAYHFFDETERAKQQAQAVKENDFHEFLRLVKASGDSSFKYLQNVFSVSDSKEQGVSLALYLAEKILDGSGACRVHGGGFGGTTQNFVPLSQVDEFKEKMEAVFGIDSCHVVTPRLHGVNMLII